jgi:hypothetical protein
MSRATRVCFWATTFGPDQIALAWELDRRDDFQVLVAVDDPATVSHEASLRRHPLSTPLVDKGALSLWMAASFSPDVVVVDNGLPWVPISRAGLVQWHGYGWKGPDDIPDMIHRYLTISAHWGSPLRETSRARWACFGPQDFEHRTRVGRLHPAICRQAGAACHDVLRVPVDRAELAPFYPFDVVHRRNVLIAPTWHYGGVLGHWGNEGALLEELVSRVRSRDGNVIFRLHDRWRMEPGVLDVVHGLARRFDNVLLKFKNENPDGLADLQVADVLITNMSSIADLFYATLRPTIHVFPVADEAAPFQKRQLWMGRIRTQELGSARQLWKLRPEINGGMMARSREELLSLVDRALDEPDCCRDHAREFLDTYMLGADGQSCERLIETIRELVDAT